MFSPFRQYFQKGYNTFILNTKDGSEKYIVENLNTTRNMEALSSDFPIHTYELNPGNSIDNSPFQFSNYTKK